MDTGTIGRLLLFAGLFLVLAGVLFLGLSRLMGGQAWRLPGDIVLRRDHVTIYIPIATSILLSLLLTALLWALALLGRR